MLFKIERLIQDKLIGRRTKMFEDIRSTELSFSREKIQFFRFSLSSARKGCRERLGSGGGQCRYPPRVSRQWRPMLSRAAECAHKSYSSLCHRRAQPVQTHPRNDFAVWQTALVRHGLTSRRNNLNVTIRYRLRARVTDWFPMQ